MVCSCDFVFPSRPEWEAHYDNCKDIWEKRNGREYPRNLDGTLKLANPYLSELEFDNLYHLGLNTKTYDFPQMFKDIKFVCMGGTKQRMKALALYIGEVLNIQCDNLVNLTKHSHRYAMYIVGPVLCVNHGIGIPSMTVVLEEVIKLLHYARVVDPILFRIGTCGGLGVPAGSVVVSSWAMNGTFEKCYEIPILGKVRKLPSIFDKRLAQELTSLAMDSDGFITVSCGTMAANEFYRGQGRLDGPFCDYTISDKIDFLNTLLSLGVRNIEMEATAFAALTEEAAIRSADLCVTFLDRLHGDQVTPTKETLNEWQKRPMRIVAKYIHEYWRKINT